MFDDFEFNPWNVTSLDNFRFYCCPECDTKNVTKTEFIKHAVIQHPKSQNVIDTLEGKKTIKSESEVKSKTSDKSEIVSDITSSPVPES